MQFIIDGTTYEAANLERITGRDALELPKQAGMGVQTLARRLQETSRLAYASDGSVIVLPEGTPGSEGDAVLDSEPHLRALLAFVWMSRRLDGEPTLTFEQACEFPIMTLDIVLDEDEAAAAPDPTQPGFDPATGPEAPDSPTT